MEVAPFSPPDEFATTFYIGQLETPRSAFGPTSLLNNAQNLGYDFATTPITTHFFYQKVLKLVEECLQGLDDTSDLSHSFLRPYIPPLTPQDTDLTPEDGNASLVAIVSPWIDLGSKDPIIAHFSRQILNIEVAYAAFCGVNNIVVAGPTEGGDNAQFGRAVAEALGLGPYVQIYVALPMSGELDLYLADEPSLSEFARPQFEADVDENNDIANDLDVWEAWNTIRTICNYSSKLSTALEVPRHLPAASLQSRWLAEPVRLLLFPRTAFLRNAKSYPVLSKPHQQLLSLFARLRAPPWLVLGDVGKEHRPSADQNQPASPSDPTPAEATRAVKEKEKSKDPAPHLRYLRHLQQTQPLRPPIERFGQGYQDYLQSPLQPLTDNLESITYEVFEKDPVKYEWYERAIAGALKDLDCRVQGNRTINIAVVGAGRGPLVTRALQASQKTGVRSSCWAVEKNPNAFVLLQRRNVSDPLWGGQVKIIKSDMRHWSGPSVAGEIQKVDILVSELLGSFGDNELSPECLDGVQHVLHPDHGINIPQRYSAHLTPISTPKIYNDLLGRSGSEKWELPYVVMLHQYDTLCRQGSQPDASPLADVKEAWSFSHPIPSAIISQSRLRAGGSMDHGGWVGGDGSDEHNARSCKLRFTCQERGICHGLAGYFETVLYAGSAGKVELSTNPVTMEEKSKDMISWFPIFFPLKTPIVLPDHSEIEVSMWRQTDDRSVWYEWLVEVFAHVGQRRARIALSELHSSRKNGCLM